MSMNQLLSAGRSLLPKVVRNFSHSTRLAAEADPDDYGHFPDPIEHSWGVERKMMIARLKGDDRYEPKVYYRAEHTTREYPNLVPVHMQDKIVACLCEPNGESVNYWHIRKGQMKRCECGHWFKGVEAHPDSFA